MNKRIVNARPATSSIEVSLDPESLKALSDEKWAELLTGAVHEFRRVWIGQHGMFVERAVIGKTDCLSIGIRESDGMDVGQEVVAFAALVGDELRRGRGHFDCMLLDAADADQTTISGTRFQVVYKYD